MDSVSVELSGTERLDENTKDACDALITDMRRVYCYVNSSEFQNPAEEHNNWQEEGVTEFKNLVLADHHYHDRREADRENITYENLTEKEMDAFAGMCEKGFSTCWT